MRRPVARREDRGGIHRASPDRYFAKWMATTLANPESYAK
ncbi:hypothetical protein BURCENBC7_AP2943 [Burkholderia cenocepacia BC7]|nr:uncharacterized protein BCN122_II1330 [Burkholderia cenocepacia]EPZ90658.1 hypothetical protein BURCENK562V_C3354 [Burkholderia cenocepacia K56-2Valvano]ERI28402.1 hypothetical protein BURCENBC7_AP2943 [Burkholderia cenocepacia BC7]